MNENTTLYNYFLVSGDSRDPLDIELSNSNFAARRVLFWLRYSTYSLSTGSYMRRISSMTLIFRSIELISSSKGSCFLIGEGLVRDVSGVLLCLMMISCFFGILGFWVQGKGAIGFRVQNIHCVTSSTTSLSFSFTSELRWV